MVDADLAVAQRSLRILIVHRASRDTITDARDAVDALLEERSELRQAEVAELEGSIL